MTVSVSTHVLRFFGLFGDDVDVQRARDMSRRVVPMQMLAVAIGTLACLTGVLDYGFWPPLLLALSEIGFLAATVLPRWLKRPELPLIVSWLIGQGLLIAAVVSAGDHRAYLWGIAAISIQFIGVIWTPALSMAAVLASLAAVTAAAWVQDSAGITALPAELLPVALLLVITAGAASTLRAVDHESRGNVLVDGLHRPAQPRCNAAASRRDHP